MIIIRKVKAEHGCWGNMAPFPIIFDNKEWRTTEALFQALRFSDEKIREQIRLEKSPMSAKMIAKSLSEKMTITPMSDEDLDNMRLCLRLKVEQHPELLVDLLRTQDLQFVEDCTKRQHGSGLFWGAANNSGEWVGKNWLGKLWMELRKKIRDE